MHQLITDFVQDVLSQLFGVSIPRAGSVRLTNHAFLKMLEHGLSFDYLVDAFRFGETVGADTIMRAYPDFTIGLIYKRVIRKAVKHYGREKQFVIITCWKGVRHG
jgi:hypothetical protein